MALLNLILEIYNRHPLLKIILVQPLQFIVLFRAFIESLGVCRAAWDLRLDPIFLDAFLDLGDTRNADH